MLGNTRKVQPRRLLVAFLCLFIVFASVLPASPVAHASDSSNADEIVCVTDTGSKYHRPGCGYLRSRNDITLEYAVINGYFPCSRCNPPLPNFEYTVIDRSSPKEEKEEREQESASSSSASKPSQSTETSSHKPYAESSSVAFSPPKASPPEDAKPQQSRTRFDIRVCLIVVVILFPFFILYRILLRRARRQRCLRYSELLRCQQILLQKRYSQLSELYNNRSFIPLAELCCIPKGVTIDSSGLPHEIIGKGWWAEDRYVFYLSSDFGRRYHKRSCYHAKRYCPINAIDIQFKRYSYTPCKVCKPILPDTKWFSDYTALSNDQYLLMQMFEKEPGPSA